MKIAGLSISVISLVALFQTCFNLYGKIADLKRAKGDLEEVEVRQEMEMRRFKG